LLWTVNREFQGRVALEKTIIDCTVTSFPCGTQKNYAIYLAKYSTFVTLKLPSLKYRPELTGEMGIQGGISIKSKNDNLTGFGTVGAIKWRLGWSK
jgi:hypothetical protein